MGRRGGPILFPGDAPEPIKPDFDNMDIIVTYPATVTYCREGIEPFIRALSGGCTRTHVSRLDESEKGEMRDETVCVYCSMR